MLNVRRNNIGKVGKLFDRPSYYVLVRFWEFISFILRLFPTTLKLEKAMAAPAIMGLSRPKAASGIAAIL